MSRPRAALESARRRRRTPDGCISFEATGFILTMLLIGSGIGAAYLHRTYFMYTVLGLAVVMLVISAVAGFDKDDE